MAKAQVVETIKAPADKVWAILGDFGGVKPNAMVKSCTVQGEGVGAVRTITLQDGSQVIERLEKFDPATKTFAYRIINESPIPVSDYVSTVIIKGSGSETIVDWSSTFEPRGAPEATVVDAVKGIYTGLIGDTRTALGA